MFPAHGFCVVTAPCAHAPSRSAQARPSSPSRRRSRVAPEACALYGSGSLLPTGPRGRGAKCSTPTPGCGHDPRLKVGLCPARAPAAPAAPAAPPGYYGSPRGTRSRRPRSQSVGAAGRPARGLAPEAPAARPHWLPASGGIPRRGNRGCSGGRAGQEAARLAGPESRLFRFPGLTFLPLGRAPSRL